MKQLILSLIVIAFSASFANASAGPVELAKYKFAQAQDGENLFGSRYDVYTVKYFNNSTMEVTKRPRLQPMDRPLVSVEVKLVPLSQAANDVLKNHLLAFYNGVVIQEMNHGGPVCAMVPNAAQYYDHLHTVREIVDGQLGGPMELVQGPRGCWVADPVYLENEDLNSVAFRFKTHLKLLALQAFQ